MNVALFGDRVFADDRVKMRSLGWALIQHDPVFINKGHLDTETVMHTGEAHLSRKPGMWVRHLQTRDGQQTTRARGGAWNRPSLTALRRSQPCGHPDLGLWPPDCEKHVPAVEAAQSAALGYGSPSKLVQEPLACVFFVLCLHRCKDTQPSPARTRPGR